MCRRLWELSRRTMGGHGLRQRRRALWQLAAAGHRIPPSSIRLREALSNVGRSGKAETGVWTASYPAAALLLHANNSPLAQVTISHRRAMAVRGRGPSAAFKASFCCCSHGWKLSLAVPRAHRCCRHPQPIPPGAKTHRARAKNVFHVLRRA